MKSRTSEFKEEIKTLGKQQSVRITYTLNNEQIILTDEDINSATPNYEASLLKSVMKVLELDSNVSIPKGTEIKFEYGLLVNGAYEYLDYGNYIVAKEPEKQEDTLSYKITCYDKMLYSMKDYEHIEVNYPCKIKKFLIELCKKIGLEFKDSTFANQDREFANELFMTINEDGTYSSMGYTYRDVLDQIAETTGGCICITLDDKVEVRYINKTLEYSTSKNTNEVEIETQVKEKVKTINTDGNRYQETTEGYNIANLDRGTFTLAGVTVTNNGDGSFTFNGTSTSAADLILTKTAVLNSNIYQFEDAKYLLKTFVISGDFSNPDNGGIRILCMGRSNDTDNYNMLYNDLKKNIFSKLFTMHPTDTLGRIEMFINPGITFNNYTIKILLAKTDNVNLPYEPYTGKIPSPSPDYPQEITNVGEYDNLFDKNNIISGSYVSDGNGAFVSNSTSKRTDYIGIQANSYYYIYSDKTSGNWGAWYDKDKKFISGITLGGHKEGVVNSPANAKYIAFTISYQGNLTDYSNIKINETVIKIKQSGKNLLNVPAEYHISSTDINKIVPISLKANTTYTIQAEKIISDNSDVKDCLFRFRYNNADVSNPYARIPISTLKTTYTPPSDIDTVWIYSSTGYNESRISSTTFENLMIYEGTEETPYEPYHEPIITPINLQGNILSKVGDVKDILKVNRNGEVEIKKNIEKIVLTGEENLIDNSSTSTRKYWGIDFSNYGIYQYNDPTKVCDVLTTKFKSRPQQGIFLPGQVALTTNNKHMYFVFKPDTTEEQARAILKDMPVYFRLAEPQTIKLSSISPIELWQGTNIFSLVTNLDTEIELEYPTNYDTIDEEYINDTNVNFGEKYRTY